MLEPIEKINCPSCGTTKKRNVLTPSESVIASKVSKGMRNQAIANELFVTEKTVKFHLTNIYRKLKLKTRYELIVAVADNPSLLEAREDLRRYNRFGGADE